MNEIEECKKLIDSLQQKNNELENTLKSYEERLNYLETQHIEDALTRSDTALKVACKNKRNLRHILAFVFVPKPLMPQGVEHSLGFADPVFALRFLNL
jgi:hypothetical protein